MDVFLSPDKFSAGGDRDRCVVSLMFFDKEGAVDTMYNVFNILFIYHVLPCSYHIPLFLLKEYVYVLSS